MLQLALRGVRHNVGRYLATLIAIMTGVAFFTATGFLSERVIDALEGDVDRQFSAVDVAIVPDQDATDAASAAEDLVLPGDALDAIAATDGVEAVAGQLTGPVAFSGEDAKPFATGATGRLWVVDEELNPIDVIEGVGPEAADEVAVDRDLAESEDLEVGDTETLLAVGGQFEVTIVGITEFGSAAAIDPSGTVSLPEASVFDVLTGGTVEYQQAYLRGSGSEAELTEAVSGEVPEGFRAQSGEEFRADQRESAGAFGRALKTGLQAFATLALLVGGFVIYNTFSVIIAQRQRELAVLSAIGATPKQLKRSLRFEGILIGLLGSALGVIVGFGLTYLLIAVLSAFGIALPGSGVKVTPQVVSQGLFSGTIITIASVMIPARRAAKIEPIEALREAATESGTVPRRRKIAAIVLVALGLLGLFGGTAAAGIGLGALLLVIGTLVASPLLALGGAKVLRPILGRFGLEGQLAVDNSVRNPKRTATTANALLIGVFLVTFVTVAGTSLKDFAIREIKKLESADFVVSSQGGTLDDELLASIAEVEGVASVAPFRREAASIDGNPGLISTPGSGDLVDAAGLKVDEGSLDDLVPGTIALANSAGVGASTGGDGDAYALGDTITVTTTGGASLDLEVIALLQAGLDQAQIGDLLSAEDFDELVGDSAPTVAFVDAVDGTESDTEDLLNDALATRPDIAVIPGNAIGLLIGQIFDFMISAINGLLLMSVLVALIGIVNTLSLSIIERRRELGLLRIIGMTDDRVQRMVRLESALISALGTVTGVVLGLVVGWGSIFAINRTTDAAIGAAFPGTQLAVVLVLGLVLGVLASVIPARRSTRLEVLDAVKAS
jgi:putative ABC transport system permease protein